MAGKLPPGLTMRAINAEFEGATRVPLAGSDESGVEVRRVIQSASVLVVGLAGRVNGPVKVAPACSRMVSPPFAAFKVACRLPPAGTVQVVACAVRIVPFKSKRIVIERKVKGRLERKVRQLNPVIILNLTSVAGRSQARRGTRFLVLRIRITAGLPLVGDGRAQKCLSARVLRGAGFDKDNRRRSVAFTEKIFRAGELEVS
jgi:hypothetical protein